MFSILRKFSVLTPLQTDPGVIQMLYWRYWQRSPGGEGRLLLNPAVAQSGDPVVSCFPEVPGFFPLSLLRKGKG